MQASKPHMTHISNKHNTSRMLRIFLQVTKLLAYGSSCFCYFTRPVKPSGERKNVLRFCCKHDCIVSTHKIIFLSKSQPRYSHKIRSSIKKKKCMISHSLVTQGRSLLGVTRSKHHAICSSRNLLTQRLRGCDFPQIINADAAG